MPNDEPTLQDALMYTQRRERLHQAVTALLTKHRTVLQWHYFEELSYKEIATRQHRPLSTVKGQLNQGRAVLQRALAHERESLLNYEEGWGSRPKGSH